MRKSVRKIHRYVYDAFNAHTVSSHGRFRVANVAFKDGMARREGTHGGLDSLAGDLMRAPCEKCFDGGGMGVAGRVIEAAVMGDAMRVCKVETEGGCNVGVKSRHAVAEAVGGDCA